MASLQCKSGCQVWGEKLTRLQLLCVRAQFLRVRSGVRACAKEAVTHMSNPEYLGVNEPLFLLLCSALLDRLGSAYAGQSSVRIPPQVQSLHEFLIANVPYATSS